MINQTIIYTQQNEIAYIRLLQIKMLSSHLMHYNIFIISFTYALFSSTVFYMRFNRHIKNNYRQIIKAINNIRIKKYQ